MSGAEDSHSVASARRQVAVLEAENAQLRGERDRAVAAAARVATFLDSQATPITYLGLDGSVLAVNAAAAKNLGGAPAEVVGKSIFEAFPEHAARTRERIQLAVQRREPVVVDGHVDLASGTRWFRSIYSPVLDASGVVTAVQLLSQDVTELKRAEAAFAEQQHQLTTVMDNAPYTIVILERDSTIRYINRVSPGYRLEDVVGQRGELFVPDADRETYLRCLSVVFEESKDQQFNFTDAMGHHWEAFIVPVEGESPVRRAVSFAVDVTDRKNDEQRHQQLETQMQHAQKLESLGILAGGIAHDFNNLLVGVLGNAELALAATSPAASRAHIQDIIASARSAADLCRQMLAYSGKGKFVVRPVALSEIVREMLDLLRASISKRAVIECEFAEGLPPVEGDVAQLRQVVMNLILNASDALGDEDGTIKITTSSRLCRQASSPNHLVSHIESGQHVVLEVADTGCGMDETTQQRMFEPFFTSKEPGRGLGLAAVHGIIRGHDGCLEVESKPGQGTKVLVCLPASTEATVASSEDDATSAPTAVGGTVLVVDDDPAVRRVSQLALEGAGYRVLTACDGAEALATFEQRCTEIVAVLLDLSMPRMGGRETLDALRALDVDVRVVITSGYHQGDAIEQLGESDRVGFLPKPSSLDQLLAAIERVRA